MAGLIDEFVPQSDVAECHETIVRAPPEIVFAAAIDFDLEGLPAVRAIFRLRELLLGARPGTEARPTGIVARTENLGWRRLAERAHAEIVMGAATQPWLADVVFRPIAPELFRDFAEPGLVKIAWTLEVEPLGPARTRLRSQTRVLATDEAARRRFRRYWRWARFGIVAIRWLMLPAVRRAAERRYRSAQSSR